MNHLQAICHCLPILCKRHDGTYSIHSDIILRTYSSDLVDGEMGDVFSTHSITVDKKSGLLLAKLLYEVIDQIEQEEESLKEKGLTVNQEKDNAKDPAPDKTSPPTDASQPAEVPPNAEAPEAREQASGQS